MSVHRYKETGPTLVTLLSIPCSYTLQSRFFFPSRLFLLRRLHAFARCNRDGLRVLAMILSGSKPWIRVVQRASSLYRVYTGCLVSISPRNRPPKYSLSEKMFRVKLTALKVSARATSCYGRKVLSRWTRLPDSKRTFFYTPDVSRYFDRQMISLGDISTLILQNSSYGRQEDVTRWFYSYAFSSFVLSIRRHQRWNIFWTKHFQISLP